MITLLSPHYKAQETTRADLVIACTAFGFTLGFGWLTTSSRFTLLSVQFLLQIIVNRCGILLTNKKKAYRLKVIVGTLITAVNISVYCIWIPARLQISERYIHINEWWDRCEKVIYLIVDGCLNFYFIHIVRINLIIHGLTKYKRLTQFNMFIIGFSLSMDVLIITMMSLRNTFVYMQFHPLAYTVKLHIEMSMADLIGKIARDKQCGIIAEGTFSSTVSNGTYTTRNRTYSEGTCNGTYHLEDVAETNSQTRLAEQEETSSVSKPRQMFRTYSRKAGEYERDLPEP
ncbi:hypothetical protein F53441_6589 [Fusarium austroafricanum]|uniref:Uncharacterized protein n=1 Tax=Fusarium austroafricanum TaxID=2364996 RepID=A0A8H4KHL1_9HYPO|nr:hypothetical protein F53441_6589 [Fusarium austroafricanum]